MNSYQDLPNLTATADDGPSFAYRDTGGNGIPLVLLQDFRGNSYVLAGLLPDAKVKIYPDSAHGFLFQHHQEFAADVDAFLATS